MTDLVSDEQLVHLRAWASGNGHTEVVAVVDEVQERRAEAAPFPSAADQAAEVAAEPKAEAESEPQPDQPTPGPRTEAPLSDQPESESKQAELAG